MAQIMAGDLRKGVTFLYDNKIMTIVDFLHVKPGKGAAFVRTKMKNVVTGAVLEQTFNPTEKFELAHIETKTMEYLYNDGEFYYFMDADTYEQIPLNKSQVEDALNFVKENMNVTMKFQTLSNFSSPFANPQLQATPQPTQPSPQPSKQVMNSKCLCLSTKGILFVSILAPANTCQEYKSTKRRITASEPLTQTVMYDQVHSCLCHWLFLVLRRLS